MKEEEKILNDPFVQHILTKPENRINTQELKKWVDRCKVEVQLSKPRHDGNDICAWNDECEAWLTKTAKKEGKKVSIIDTILFRDQLKNWLENYYDSVA